MKKIRIGQIGTQHDHAGDLIVTLKKMPETYEIVGLGVPEGEPLRSPELYHGIPQMSVEALLEIKGLDAVLIEASETDLTRYALMAINRGLPVHMDKPGGILLSDFEQLIETVKKSGCVFHTGYMYRFNPAVQKLRRQIASGMLGRVYSVEAHMSCSHNAQKRRWLSQFPGGMMFFLGCHLIDMICCLQGFPSEVVPFNCATCSDGVDAQDYGFAVLKYDHGLSFAKTCANELGGFMRRQLVVCGEKGAVQLLPFEAPPDVAHRTWQYTGVRECLDPNGGWFYPGTQYQTGLYDRYIPMMEHFAACVRGEIQNEFTPDYELNVYRTVLRACGVSVP